MVFSTSLRRMLANRVKGSSSRRKRAVDDEEAPRRRSSLLRRHYTVKAPRSNLDDDDMEAAQPRRRRFAREAEHGMFSMFRTSTNHSSGEVPQEEEVDDPVPTFDQFYKGKVLEMQEKEGGLSHIPISGNLYMYKALQPFADKTGLFQKKDTPFVKVGLVLIMFLQVFAPLGMLIPALVNIEFGNENSMFGFIGVHHFTAYTIGSEEWGVSHFFQRWLGLFFLLLFLMNGLYVLENDRLETQKLTELVFLFRSVRHELKDEDGNMPPRPSTFWLWIGAIMNSICLILCSCAMVFVFVIEEGPKDLILDAFGLAFLYNLDDIGGDLAFLDEKWDEDFIGDIYGELDDLSKEQVEKARRQNQISSPSADEGEASPDVDLGGESTTRNLLADDAPAATKSSVGFLEEAQQKRADEFTPDTVFWMTRLLVMALHIILPVTYVFVEMKPKE